MKIGRFETEGGRRFWGAVDTSALTVRPIEVPFTQWAPTACGPDPAPIPLTDQRLSLADLKFLPPVDPVGRVLGTGANYVDHLKAFGVELPEQPPWFIKPDTAVIGHKADIRYPSLTEQLDFEIELVAVVGKRVDEPGNRSSGLLGFTVGNDTSLRDAVSPLGGPDLFTMKGVDGISPVGPWITTLDEFGGSAQPSLEFALRVNGEQRQQQNTKNMHWSVEQILEFLDQRVALRTGDAIFTGTCAGVAMEDGRWLQPGDVVEAEIEGIGTLRNRVGERRS